MDYNNRAKETIAEISEQSLISDFTLSKNDFQSIWGYDEAGKYLGWFDAPNNTNIITEIKDFISQENINLFENLIFLGIGGATITAEVLMEMLPNKDKKQIKILDNIEPSELNNIANNIEASSTLFIIISKSGNTIETLSQLSFFWNHFPFPKQYIAITEENSTLDQFCVKNNFLKIFHTPKNIGGRFASLSYFGLIPAILFGLDIERFINVTKKIKNQYTLNQQSNDASNLGALIGRAIQKNIQTMIIVVPTQLEYFAKWIEQLVAESLGKNKLGITPVIYFEEDDINITTENAIVIDYSKDQKHEYSCPAIRMDIEDISAISAEFYMWQVAVAYSGQLLKINPFDQPDVESVKITKNNVRNNQENKIKSKLTNNFFNQAKLHKGRIHILSFGAKNIDYINQLHNYKNKITSTYNIQVTLQFGPRYLHSVGQLHKGGRVNSSFIIINNIQEFDTKVPGTNFTFNQIISAQMNIDAYHLYKQKKDVVMLTVEDLGSVIDRI